MDRYRHSQELEADCLLISSDPGFTPSLSDDKSEGPSTFSDTDTRVHTRPRNLADWKHGLSRGSFVVIPVVVLLFLIFGVSYVTVYHRSATKEGKQCGNNPSTARANGCTFEPMLSAWVPKECSYPEVVQKYQETYGDIHLTWAWYWDKNATQRVAEQDLNSLRAGNYSAIYTSFGPSHDLHCLYCWFKYSTAMQNNFTRTDSRSASLEHARHCSQHVTTSLYHPEVYSTSPPEVWGFPMMYHNCVDI